MSCGCAFGNESGCNKDAPPTSADTGHARKSMEPYKIWGLIAILVHFAALIVGMVAIYPHSMTHFWIYVGIVVVSTFGIIFSFCSKCPCHKHQCSHIVLGPMTRLLPERKVSKYTKADYWGLGLSYLVGIAYPEYWIWKSTLIPFLFYPLVVATLAIILVLVCPHCRNCNCPFNRHPKNPKYRTTGKRTTAPTILLPESLTPTDGP